MHRDGAHSTAWRPRIHASNSAGAVSPAGHAILPLRVELIEPLGAETLVHGKLAGGEAELTARVDGEAPIKLGATMRFAVEPRHLHLFDRSSGARLQ